MKILHVITGLNDGGAESALYRLCKHDQLNSHIVVSMMDQGKYGPMLQEMGVRVVCLCMPQGRVTLNGLFQLWRSIRESRPDAVQTWLYHADLIGGLVARLAGVVNVFWGVHHSNLSPGTVKATTIVVAKICSMVSSWIPKKIVCCSQSAVETHVELGYPREKFRVVPNGYDLSDFKPNLIARGAVRTSLKIDPRVALLGMVARYDIQKDHGNLFSALRLLKENRIEVHCLLVGAGMDEKNQPLNEKLREENIVDMVTLLGRRDDIPAVMNALDIHVLSSLGEAFPNVLSEAMACGTPCVATDVGDSALIVGSTGWIVPPKNEIALSDAISVALDARCSEADWLLRQRAARLRVKEKFSIDRVAALYNSVWNCSSELL